MRRLLLSAVSITLFLPAAARAQEADPIAAFNKSFGEWKQVLEKLRDIQRDYKTAKPEDRRRLEQEFNEGLADAGKRVPALKKLAEAAYESDPQQNDIGDFLGAMAESELDESDNFLEALRISEFLIKLKYRNSDIFRVAGVSAFYLDQLDDAEKYLKLAGEGRARGLRDEPNLLELLSKERELWDAESKLRMEEDKPDDDPMALPRVLIKTTKGDIVAELFENEAPNTVANFISLAEKKFYDGVVFHRVLEHFMAQTGCPEGTGKGGPGYKIKCECVDPKHRKHFLGSLSMAHAGKDTGGSQFFITFLPTRHLDGMHTVFGRVISGVDVLPKINRRDPESPKPGEPDKIISVTVLRKRDHEYKPVKIDETPATKPEEKKGDDKKAGETAPDDKKAGEKEGEEKKGEDKKTGEAAADDKKTDDKKP
jgi:cyclophilin family peptidyl-prolyl cis-trans isomerase